jgi:hypothetical protein
MKNPSTVETLLNHAIDLASKFEYETAEKFALRVLEIEERNVDALELLGDIYVDAGHVDKAVNVRVK